jgi:demethylmenaquinone methyltransferase/2-methoxy-6-polyprenyl-1,4-benzoquinol methylase
MRKKETNEDATADPGRETDFGFRRVREDEKAPLVRAVFDSVASRYDLMNDLMSGFIHRRWKDQLIAWLAPHPGQILLDVAGGTGDIACRAVRRLDPARGGNAIVCDVNEPMLDIGRARAIDDGIITGLEWVCGDAEALPIAERSVDLYTIAFGLRNVTHIENALAEARRVLKPGGRFMCLEFAPEAAPWLAPAYDLYSFRLLPLLGQIVTGDRDAYAYLVESIRRFPSQAGLCDLIEAAGLERPRFRDLTGGIAALHSAWRL